MLTFHSSSSGVTFDLWSHLLHPVRLAAKHILKGVGSCLQNGRHVFFCLQYTFEELLDHVQASENEVWEALEKLQSCVINGEPVLNQV